MLTRLKIGLKAEEVEGLANSSPGLVERLIYRVKKMIEKGDMPSPSVVSKNSKANTSLSFGMQLEDKPKQYHKMPYS